MGVVCPPESPVKVTAVYTCEQRDTVLCKSVPFGRGPPRTHTLTFEKHLSSGLSAHSGRTLPSNPGNPGRAAVSPFSHSLHHSLKPGLQPQLVAGTTVHALAPSHRESSSPPARCGALAVLAPKSPLFRPHSHAQSIWPLARICCFKVPVFKSLSAFTGVLGTWLMASQLSLPDRGPLTQELPVPRSFLQQPPPHPAPDVGALTHPSDI